MILVARRVVLICLIMLFLYPPVAEKAYAGETYRAQVTADRLNVRAAPSAGSKLVSILANGAIVTVSNESNGWLKMQSGQITGWVSGQYVKKLNDVSKPSATKSNEAKTSSVSGEAASNERTSGNGQGTVTADSLWLRSGPGTDTKTIVALEKGAALTIVKRENGWLQVRTSTGTVGWVSARYVDETSGDASAQKERTGGLKDKLIVIDPGHGGDDPGVIGSKYKTIEKTINLKTSQYVAEELRRYGAKVIMTRTDDKQQPELSQRAASGDKQKADAFISIHYNASPKKVSGTLTFYYSASKDRPLARSIEARLAKGIGLKSNGISFGDYHVLRENERPAVLLELGFLTDSGDEATVRKDDYQKKAAKAIALGLNDYFGG